jgi:ubiquinone/menaquinone biosynthesis C-methylase UbiE
VTARRGRRAAERVWLTRLAIGGWAAQALFAANELGVFDDLARSGPSSADDVAGRLGTERDATERLLGALAAAEVLEHDGDTDVYANGAAAREFLVSGTDESMATWLALIGQWNRTFSDLAASVRTGQPAELPEEHLGLSDDYTRRFIIGMHDYAIGPGRELAKHLDLANRTRLLDVGGGPGTYSVLLAEANPQLNCTIFDLPDVVRIAEEVIAERGLSGRVTTAAGDYHSDEFPRGFDSVLVSNTLHQEDDETCLRILRQSFESLESGGLVTVHAMFLNEDHDGPLWPALHNLLMLLVYRGGRAYTVGETFELMTRAGFEAPEHHRMSVYNAGSFVTARRP